MNKLAEFLPEFMHFNAVDAANLILLLGLIMFLGACGGKLFQKLKIPQVVGYIVIGIIIGQSGFQVLRANVINALNPLSTIALSFIGFLIGAELKTSVIKKYGKQFAGILIFESVTPFIVVSIIVSAIVFCFTKDWNRSVSLGLVLGAISSATAPAATTDVLKENRTKGPLTTTVLGIVALDDAVALFLYAIASSIATNLLGSGTSDIALANTAIADTALAGGIQDNAASVTQAIGTQASASLSFGTQLLHIAYDIFGSIALGSLFGFFLGRIIKHVLTDEGRILSFSLGTLFLCTGVASILNLDNILAAMSVGFFLVNFSGSKIRATFSLVEKFTPPIYVLFFVLVGAKLNIWKITSLVGIIALGYVVCRTLGKSIGSRIGSKLTHAPKTVERYLPFCLLSQAGVAIGLSISAGHDFANTIGASVMLIITATTFIVQIVGPVCVKYGMQKSGECNLDVNEEDILKQFTVGDVTQGGIKICNPNSPSILNENDTLQSIIDSFSKNQNQNYVVKDKAGCLSGIITLGHLKESLAMSEFCEGVLAIDISEKSTACVNPKTTLSELQEIFAKNDKDAMPIVGDENQVIGICERNAVEHFLHAKMVEIQSRLSSMDA